MRFNLIEHNTRGQAATLMVLLMPVLIGLVGLVVDGGLLLITYREAQIATDSAAYAAATTLDSQEFDSSGRRGKPCTQLVQLRISSSGEDRRFTASDQAERYGARNGRGRVQIHPPIVQGNRVTVVGTAQAPLVFLRILGVEPVKVRVVAHAHLAYGIEDDLTEHDVATCGST